MVDHIKRLAAAMDPSIDAALITSQPNRFYFTGFRSTAGTLFITREKAYFIVDFRYIENARQVIQNCEILLQGDLTEQLNQLIKKHDVRTVGVEYRYTTLSQYEGFAKALNAKVLSNGLLNAAIDRQRAVKTPEEIANLRAAQDMTDKSFSYILNYIRAGITEQDLILELGGYMERLGNENRNYDFIAISGQKTSLPHGKASTKVIEPGDFVTLDFGCMVGGYFSDMTRTVAVGHVSDEQRKVYEIVKEAQSRAFAQIRPGAICNQVDAAARDYIAGEGYGDCFGHGLGHSVGIEIHEDPRFNQVCTDALEVGNVLTVEPGIYLENQFGVRIEDMIVVTENGYENLTHSNRDLIIL